MKAGKYSCKYGHSFFVYSGLTINQQARFYLNTGRCLDCHKGFFNRDTIIQYKGLCM
jgi:hypothetical protein